MSWRICMSDRRTSLHSWRMRWHCVIKTFFWKRTKKLPQIYGACVNDILQQQQQQKMLISQNERARDRAAGAYSLKGSEEKGKYLRSLDIKKARAGKAENVLSNLTLQSKEKTKINWSRSPGTTDNSAERQYTPKTGRSPSGEEDRSPSFNHERGNCRDDRDCDYWHLLHCKYFKDDKCELGKDFLFVHPQTRTRPASPPRKGRGKAT